MPYQITLNGNQTCHSYAPFPADLSGTTPTSATPFVVYGGRTAGLVSDINVDFAILVGGMSMNACSEQSFFASHRIEGGQLFRGGFEN